MLSTSPAAWRSSQQLREYSALSTAQQIIGALAPCATTHVSPDEVRLAQKVNVDLRKARSFAHCVLDRSAPLLADELGPVTAAIESLSAGVLPDWYDNWALLAAEDWRQHTEAVTAAQAAVHGNPLAWLRPARSCTSSWLGCSHQAHNFILNPPCRFR